MRVNSSGVDNKSAKLTRAQVTWAKLSRLGERPMPVARIAQRLGVSHYCALQMLQLETYRDVPVAGYDDVPDGPHIPRRQPTGRQCTQVQQRTMVPCPDWLEPGAVVQSSKWKTPRRFIGRDRVTGEAMFEGVFTQRYSVQNVPADMTIGGVYPIPDDTHEAAE